MTPHFETALTSLKKLTDEFSSSLPSPKFRESLRKLQNSRFEWPSLRIGNLTATSPVIQGGMGVGISLSGLAAAVAEAGGIGIIAANAIGMIEKDYFKDGRAANLRAIRSEIRKARQKTDGIIGINVMVAVNDFKEILDVAIEEKVDLIVMGAGLPIKDIPVEKMRENDVKAVPIVSSRRAMELIFKMWKKIYNDVPDAVVFEGPLAGGHIGFSEEQVNDPEYQLEAIVPQLVEGLKPFEEESGRKIPVIAGGGIYGGDDIHAALAIGASGVQMGTRFVATEECDADDAFKQAYVDCTSDQIGMIKSPVGMPGRAIRNDFIAASEEGQRPAFKCAWKCLSSCKADDAKYCISIALNNARRGKLSQGFVFAGSNAHRITKIVPVADLMTELADGYREKSREGVTARLESMLEKIRDLKGQYEGLGIKTGELGLVYEKRVSARLFEAGENSLAQVREQYSGTLGKMRDLQFQILEKLTESWAMVSVPL